MVEQLICNHQVPSSILGGGTTADTDFNRKEKQMALYEVTFRDEIEADSEEEAYDAFLKYLSHCVRLQDVTTFQFFELKKEE